MTTVKNDGANTVARNVNEIIALAKLINLMWTSDGKSTWFDSLLTKENRMVLMNEVVQPLGAAANVLQRFVGEQSIMQGLTHLGLAQKGVQSLQQLLQEKQNAARWQELQTIADGRRAVETWAKLLSDIIKHLTQLPREYEKMIGCDNPPNPTFQRLEAARKMIDKQFRSEKPLEAFYHFQAQAMLRNVSLCLHRAHCVSTERCVEMERALRMLKCLRDDVFMFIDVGATDDNWAMKRWGDEKPSTISAKKWLTEVIETLAGEKT